MEQEKKTADMALTPERASPEEVIQKLMDVMSRTGNPEVAENLQMLSLWAARMQSENSEMKQQIAAMQTEIAQLQESPVKQALHGALSATQDRIHAVGEQIAQVREAVNTWARDTLGAIRDGGVAVLDTAVYALHLKPMLEAVQHGINGALESVRAAVDRAEAMGFELRKAGRALSNAARAAKGNELDTTSVVTEGKFQTVVLLPVRGVKATLNAMNESTLGAVAAVERLEQAGRESRARLANRKPSIRQQLEEGKARAASRPAPLPDRSARRAEAAL